MTDNATPVESLIERAENYGKTTFELFKLQAIDKSADVVSSLISRMVVITSVALSVLILNIGISLWLGKLLGDSFYGFYVVGGAYAFIALLLHVLRHSWVKNPISNLIINQLLKTK